MQLEHSYDKQGRRGLLGFGRTGESPDGERNFTMNDIVVVTEVVSKVIEV